MTYDDGYEWDDPKAWGEQLTDLWDNRDKTVPFRCADPEAEWINALRETKRKQKEKDA